MEPFTKYLAVAIGSAFGGITRFYINNLFIGVMASFPIATFIINITGSFILGLVIALISEGIKINSYLQIAFTIGFVGAYTTFSTFEYETALLVERRKILLAIVYVVLSVVIGFVSVWSGSILARKIISRKAVINFTFTKTLIGLRIFRK